MTTVEPAGMLDMEIAKRKLTIQSDGKSIDVEIRLYKPSDDDGASSCRYEIDWPSGTVDGYGFGVDGVQSILIALQKIGIILYTSEYHKNSALEWEGSAGYGFPVARNVRDLLVGDDIDM